MKETPFCEVSSIIPVSSIGSISPAYYQRPTHIFLKKKGVYLTSTSISTNAMEWLSKLTSQLGI